MNDPEFTPHEPEQDLFPAPELALPLATEFTDEPTELFQSWSQPEPVAPMRIPHLGHLALLAAFLIFGVVCMMVAMMIALHFHFDGVSSLDQIKTNIHYLLGSEAVLYLVTFSLSFFIFPLFWNKSFFEGIHWRGKTALRLYWQLPAIALGCIALAAIDDKFLPGPSKAPIEDIFRSPGAAWLMFGFGVTLAPFFEEIGFRGFLLPSLATAWDWTIEKSTGKPAPPLDENGHPQWSIFATVIASIATSLPFALMHAEQTAWSLGPFLLLFVVSLILCAVRVRTRSLAASTLVHSCYNFLIFSTALISTDGFRHLDKM
ncbi:MAG: CPBP family intramembrane glutamic endopeptidase [Terracidiphilus sp.]|jgi:membrane protease YdiL (CAAX protease family)